MLLLVLDTGSWRTDGTQEPGTEKPVTETGLSLILTVFLVKFMIT